MRTIFVEKVIPRMLAVKLLRPIWSGVVWTPLSAARVAEIEEPPLPGPRGLRVRNRQCGICGTDLSLLFVKADPAIGLAALPGHQRIYLGHEVVSEVAEVGPEVTGLRVGDRVIMSTRHAGPNCYTQGIEPVCAQCADGQTRLCMNASLGLGPEGVGGGWGDGYTAHETEVFAVPPSIDDDAAAMVEPMAIALHAVLRRPPAAGGHVLVVGAGTIGLFTLQAARALAPNGHITVMARYRHQADMAKRLGADEVLVGGDAYADIARITHAHLYRAPLNRGMLLGGLDVIYDCVGSRGTITDALRWARAGGAVVLVGVNLGSLQVDLNPVWNQEVDLIGSGFFGVETFEGRRAQTYDLVIEMLLTGKMTAQGLITHRFPLADYRRAVATAAHHANGAIKVMFTM
jgi:threonine dehydrogenase-like Zn-dependent dehydrogenase